MNRQSIDILQLDIAEAITIRNVLERFALRVNLFSIGQAQHILNWNKNFVQYHNIIGASQHVLISAHGDQNGIIMPELHSDLAEKQPFKKHMQPHDVVNFLNLSGCGVVSTACYSGNSEFGAAFLRAGAAYYIAPDNAPEAAAAFLYIINFYYWLLVKKLGVQEAYQRAKLLDNETQMFQYYY